MINYPKVVEYIKSKKMLMYTVKYSNKILTLINFVFYPVFLAVAWYFRAEKLLWYVLFPVISFVALSIFRYIYNAPRPYERFSFAPIGRDNPKAGKSFPSRHVFSAFIIGFMIFDFYMPIGVVFLVFAFLLGVIRVVSGIHFVKDVISGATVALLSYVIMLILI